MNDLPSWAAKQMGLLTPSLDDKDTPSPPLATVEEYERDKANGFNRVGKPIYGSKGGLDRD